MTYQALITSIGNEVREARAWPTPGAGAVLTDQLWVIFGAVLAVGRDLPLDHLPGLTTAAGSGHDYGDDISVTPLPSDLFYIRDDKGIVSVTLDSIRFTPAQQIDFQTLKESSTNHFQEGNPLFHLDLADGKVYFCETTTSYSLAYKPMFTQPTTGNYDSLDVPLPQPYIEQAAHLTAMHLEAIRTGNRAKSVVHQTLADYLGGVAHA